MADAVHKNNHILTQGFQCICQLRNRSFYCSSQLFDLRFQLPEKGVVRLDLAINFAAVRNDTHRFQLSCVIALVDGWQFIQSPCGVTAVIDPGIYLRILCQMPIGNGCPFFPPDE